MVLCATLRKTNSVLYNHNGYNPHKGLYPLFLFLNEKGFEEKPYSIRLKNERAWAMENVLYSHQFASNPSVLYKEPEHGIHHLQNNLLGNDEVYKQCLEASLPCVETVWLNHIYWMTSRKCHSKEHKQNIKSGTNPKFNSKNIVFATFCLHNSTKSATLVPIMQEFIKK